MNYKLLWMQYAQHLVSIAPITNTTEKVTRNSMFTDYEEDIYSALKTRVNQTEFIQDKSLFSLFKQRSLLTS